MEHLTTVQEISVENFQEQENIRKGFPVFPVVFLFFKGAFDNSLRFSRPFFGKWNWFVQVGRNLLPLKFAFFLSDVACLETYRNIKPLNLQPLVSHRTLVPHQAELRLHLGLASAFSTVIQARNQGWGGGGGGGEGGAWGAFAPQWPPTSPKGPHFDTQRPS